MAQDDQKHLALKPYVDEMVTVESQVEAALDRLVSDVAAHPDAGAATRRFQTMVKRQRDALRVRLEHMGQSEHASVGATADGSGVAEGTSNQRPSHAVSVGLQTIFTVFNRAAFGYGMLHARAHRFYDLETANLAEQHLQRYAAAAHELSQLIAAVVVWELYQGGQECQCQCPACGLGLCACVAHGTETIELAWRETTPQVAEPGFIVRPPRTSSTAAHANLLAGDIILAVDRQEIRSYRDLMAAIDKHKPGEEIQFQVRRGTGEPMEITVIRPGAA